MTYAVSGWSFTSTTVLDETGWHAQSFEVGGRAWRVHASARRSCSTRDPVAFTSWEVTGGLSLAGVTFDGTFTLDPGDDDA